MGGAYYEWIFHIRSRDWPEFYSQASSVPFAYRSQVAKFYINPYLYSARIVSL